MELLSDLYLKDGVLFLPGKSIITEGMIDQEKRFNVKPESGGNKGHD
jgi:hypothetical protein